MFKLINVGDVKYLCEENECVEQRVYGTKE